MESYKSQLSELVNEQRNELQADLDLARLRRSSLVNELRNLDRQIGLLEGLLDLAGKPKAEGTSGRRTLHQAMADVLAEAPRRMMRASDLALAIERNGLYRMRDGRPVEPQQIHARVGHYPQLFGREGTFIKLL